VTVTAQAQVELAAKLNAELARATKARRIAAHERQVALAAKALAQLERARPTLEQTAKARQVLFESQKVLVESQKLRQTLAEGSRRIEQTIKVVQLAVIRGRVCSGGRTRAARGKPIRRRGSRRTTATRAGPSGKPGGDEPPDADDDVDPLALVAVAP
jgi:hypothetical protein